MVIVTTAKRVDFDMSLTVRSWTVDGFRPWLRKLRSKQAPHLTDLKRFGATIVKTRCRGLIQRAELSREGRYRLFGCLRRLD